MVSIPKQEFADHRNVWYQPPISSTYRGHTIYETTPPSHGFMLLEILNILEGYDLASMGFYNAESVHTMVEAKKLAFADRNRYAGDPDFVDTPLSDFISKPFAAMRRRLIEATAGYYEPGPVAAPIPGDGNTSYFCVVDKEGNALSFIHSLSMGFGSGFVAGQYRRPAQQPHRSRIQPRRGTPERDRGREAHDAHAERLHGHAEGRPYLVGGTPGGDRQIAWNAQVITNVSGPSHERPGSGRGSALDFDPRH